MSEYILDAFINIVNGAVSFLYTEKFLQGKYNSRRTAMFAWTLLYTAGQFMVSSFPEDWLPYNRFIHIIPYFFILFFLQSLFFEKSRQKQAFVIVSFAAGWDILRFMASPLAHAVFSLWGSAWELAVNETVASEIVPAEMALSFWQSVNDSAVIIIVALCRAVQIGIFILYLYAISVQFPDFELNTHESIFLIFPCVTVLAIDFTIRIMAFSADNSAMMLIYDRAPETLLLLPAVSLLLLGVVISSVILFRNIMLRKDEEQKRMILENSLANLRQETDEIKDIYADMRGLKHDLRCHIASLASYMRKNSSDKNFENYISKMTDTVSRFDFSDNTGNPITDVIIHQTRQRSAKKGIEFSSEFRCPTRNQADIYDVSIILNNALKNAYEASLNLKDGKIKVRSYEKGSLFFIETENYFEGEITWDEKTGLPVTKKSGELHGIGLSNIQRCAGKYQGDINIAIDKDELGKIFKLTVMLYKKASSDEFNLSS